MDVKIFQDYEIKITHPPKPVEYNFAWHACHYSCPELERKLAEEKIPVKMNGKNLIDNTISGIDYILMHYKEFCEK
jgi:hypothetical protein